MAGGPLTYEDVMRQLQQGYGPNVSSEPRSDVAFPPEVQRQAMEAQYAKEEAKRAELREAARACNEGLRREMQTMVREFNDWKPQIYSGSLDEFRKGNPMEALDDEDAQLRLRCLELACVELAGKVSSPKDFVAWAAAFYAFVSGEGGSDAVR